MNESDTFRYWWKSTKDNYHESIFRYIESLDQSQSYRSADNIRFMRLYGNFDMAGLDAYSYNRSEMSHSVRNRVTLNVIQSMVDTVVSKVCKNKPKPMFLTSEGDFTLQNKAKKLTKYVEGVFNTSDFYEQAKKAFRDSTIIGTGAIKLFSENNEIKAERVFIDELKIDDSEAIYGKPRQIHQVKYIHKDLLVEMFPDKVSEIIVSTDSSNSNGNSQSNAKDMIRVIESWHLPSSKTSNDGKHVISLREVTLFEEEYEKSYFPFVFLKWAEKPLGFWGQGLSEQLQGIQLEINKILKTIQVSMHLVSVPKIFVEAGSKIVASHLNNKIGSIIKYAGTKPTSDSLGNIPVELFSHLDRLYSRAYEITGISQLSAQSQKPSGLDSGKALREYNNIESERFMDVSQRYENTFITAAEIMIDMARDIYKDFPEAKVKVKGKGFLETIKWSEVDMDEDKFMMDIYPTSFLSSTPSARLQDVQELLQAGFISKEDGMNLLDFPDLKATTNLLNAETLNINKQLENMIENGKYESPEPYQNLQLAIEKAQQSYLRSKAEKVPEDRLELLRRYMEDANELLKQAQTPPPLPQQDQLSPDQQVVDPNIVPETEL